MPRPRPKAKRGQRQRAADYVVLTNAPRKWENYPMSKDIEDRRREPKYADTWLGARSPARPSFK